MQLTVDQETWKGPFQATAKTLKYNRKWQKIQNVGETLKSGITAWFTGLYIDLSPSCKAVLKIVSIHTKEKTM